MGAIGWAFALIIILAASLYRASTQRSKSMRWETRSWIDDEGLGFSIEKSRGYAVAPKSEDIEVSRSIAAEYPIWMTTRFLPFLTTKTQPNGRTSLRIPLLNVELLKFAPPKLAKKDNGMCLVVEGGVLADTPLSGTVAFDFRTNKAGAEHEMDRVPTEFRTRLDNFRSRMVGTAWPLRKALRNNQKINKKLTVTKVKPPKTLEEARKLNAGLPPGVDPQPYKPRMLTKFRMWLYRETQMRIHSICLRRYHDYVWRKYNIHSEELPSLQESRRIQEHS
ncbi:hypothetical protein AAMO2058_001345500 [Amorphochlora amoebiformis]